MQGAGSLACGMENDGISEFCLSKKDPRRLVQGL